MIAHLLRYSLVTSFLLGGVFVGAPDVLAEQPNRTAARPQNIFEALFPGLIKERQRREDAFRQEQVRQAPPPIAKISAPQYYTYKVDRLVRIDLSGLKLPATPAVGEGETGGAAAELLLDSSETAAPSLAQALPTDAEIYAKVAERFANVSIMAEPQVAKALTAHYGENPKLLWVDAQLQPNARAKAALEVFASAGKFGLEPQDYAVALPVTGDEADVDAAARFEIALTARTMRYALDAAGGLVIANRLSGYHDFDGKYLTAEEAVAKIAAGDPAAVLTAFHPDNAPFKALVAELERLDSETDDSIVVPQTVLIKPGQDSTDLPVVLAAIDKRASPELRAQFPAFFNPQAMPSGDVTSAPAPALSVTQVPEVDFGTDAPAPSTATAVPLPASAETTGGIEAAKPVSVPRTWPTLYSPELVDLVKAYQKEAGLSPDGVIGRNTASRLSGVSLASKRERVVIAMEQLRWHPRDLGSRHVFINQPAFRARYVEGGATKLDMRVVVGTKANQTYFFHDTIETVEYNPYWGVPQSILVNEFLPKLRQNPAYLDERGYEVTDGKGNRIASSAIDWWSFGSSVPFDVRQSPGEANALGELKILFPNSHAIYMHDTPARDLFNKDFRAFSHGCVRLAEPRAMAAAVLGKPISHVEQMLAGGHAQDELPQKFPVYVAYFTAWPTDEGKVEYFPDIYGRDEAVLKAFTAIRAERGAAG
ncbi:MAG TPA: L,D-transpeptidase family protein [Rhizobiaceae bacterium]|nr:L,D-transpeptidase family protein [Rhizobiaceae bacterium]